MEREENEYFGKDLSPEQLKDLVGLQQIEQGVGVTQMAQCYNQQIRAAQQYDVISLYGNYIYSM